MSTVLLIEDDVWLAQLYKDALQAEGFTCAAVHSAEAALKKLENTRMPDLVLLDIFLPGHSGVELLHEIASYTDTGVVPVIILSAVFSHETGMDIERWKQYGVVDYLYKPATKPDLVVTAIKKQLVGIKK